MQQMRNFVKEYTKGGSAFQEVIYGNKHKIKERNEYQLHEGSYFVDKPNPLGLGFWVMM
jgi:hypothetical protein